jgi:hypothetical protein
MGITISDIMVYLTNIFGVNLHSIKAVQEEKANLEIMDASVYSKLAGDVLKLTSIFNEASMSILGESVFAEEKAEEEKGILTEYFSTLLLPEVKQHHNRWYMDAIKVMTNSRLAWNPEFKNLVLLILFFDDTPGDYRHLAPPLARYASLLMHKHYKDGGK